MSTHPAIAEVCLGLLPHMIGQSWLHCKTNLCLRSGCLKISSPTAGSERLEGKDRQPPLVAHSKSHILTAATVCSQWEEPTMNRRQWFDQLAATWDHILTAEDVVRLRRILGRVDMAVGSRVLDLGCGTGVLLPILLDRLGSDGQVISMDISAEMLRSARAKFCSAHWLQADGQTLPFLGQVFDWIVCNSTFPHFLDKAAALRDMRRVLKDGGRLLICHPRGREAVNAIHQSMGGAVANDLLPAEPEMRTLLVEADLENAEICDRPDQYWVLASKPLSNPMPIHQAQA